MTSPLHGENRRFEFGRAHGLFFQTGAILPKILCATDEERVKAELQSAVFCISGLVSTYLSNYKGVPVINALLNAPDLVDLVERKSLKL